MTVEAGKALIKDDDRVIAWLRGKHNGGCAPLRHFLSGPRVVNDTYGLFCYDPEGGDVAAYEKDYGYSLHGWRNGVMVVRHEDGTLFSALTGEAFAGPRRGNRLTRVPSMTTHCAAWYRMHPESTAYDLFDGKRYPIVELPTADDPRSVESRGPLEERLPADAFVLGVKVGNSCMAFPLDGLPERAVLQDKVGDWTVAVLWLAWSRSATAYRAVKDGTLLTLEPEAIAPEVASRTPAPQRSTRSCSPCTTGRRTRSIDRPPMRSSAPGCGSATGSRSAAARRSPQNTRSGSPASRGMTSGAASSASRRVRRRERS